MKNVMIALLAMGFSSAAMAEGFVCETLDGQYSIKVYNHVSPSQGTRNGAIMIISDNTIQAGRKTVASFDDARTLIDQEGPSYLANVDLRYGNSNRAGENVLGTKLGNIDTIQLDVNFSYDAPVMHNEELEGRLVVLKRNGQKTRERVACARYLKR